MTALPRGLVRLVRRAKLSADCRRVVLRVLAIGVAVLELPDLYAFARVAIRYCHGDAAAVWLVDMVTAGAL